MPIAAALALAVPRAATAQGWRETGVWGAALFSRPAFVGGGLSWSRRDAGRTRLGAAVALGDEEGAGVAGRVEGVWHFLLSPDRRSGAGIYGGGGLALAIGHDGRASPALELVLGAETAPAGPRGTFIEVGVGRGARVAVGIRWRKRTP